MHAMKFTKLSALSALLSLAIAACCDELTPLAQRLGNVNLVTRRASLSRERPLLAGDAAARLRALLASRRGHYASFTASPGSARP